MKKKKKIVYVCFKNNIDMCIIVLHMYIYIHVFMYACVFVLTTTDVDG